MKILLNSKRGKLLSNTNENITLNIKQNNNILPDENIEAKVDEYEQYLNEKKNSQKYRLSFILSPICSNVLFNNISEIVYKEGSDECIFYGCEAPSKNADDALLTNYCNYKNLNANGLKRIDFIRDTGFSHPKAGNITYHCGFDIFNNHILRKKNFNIVNKQKNNNENFNTLFDYIRNKNGDIVKETRFIADKNIHEKINKHLYTVDDVYTFEEAINENLTEKNGWVGFNNISTLNIVNYDKNGLNVSLNKCMNNNKPCEFIDMYPDRSLYSFAPKINKYRDNRVENNWDYCLTYPFRNFYDNDLVQYNNNEGIVVNGLETFVVNDELFENNGTYEFLNVKEGDYVSLKTKIRHNLSTNNLVSIVLIGYINGEEIAITLPEYEKINVLGINGKDKEHVFAIYSDSFVEYINKFSKPSEVQIRIRKVNNGGIFSYYFREFMRIPKFKEAIEINGDRIDDEIIYKNAKNNFNSSLNKLAFSKTIYGDENIEILFNDDVELTGLKDNLGRNLSEIYLTIVKNNNGYKKWYFDKNYTSKEITFSHCFGEITSGVDINDENIKDYNIHTLHNVPVSILDKYNSTGDVYRNYNKIFKKNGKEFEQPLPLEKNITINGGENENIFLGDIVEFNENTITENKLEDIYHRFNTVQREYFKENDEEFADILVDNIVTDDFDLNNQSFSGTTTLYNSLSDEIKLLININPEGYYYKPHYQIKLKEFKNKINQGAHTRVAYISYDKKDEKTYEIITSKNYYFETFKPIYFYNKNNGKKIIGKVVNVDGFNKITINITLEDNKTIEEYIVYKPNSEMPVSAYEIKSAEGIYLWKDFLDEHEYDVDSEISKYVFTNGAHYINKNINFYLRRQDPDGNYQLSNTSSMIPIISNFSINGEVNSYDDIETLIDEIEEGLIC